MTSQETPPSLHSLVMGEDIMALELGLTKIDALVHTDGRTILELHFYNGKASPVVVTCDNDPSKTISNVKQVLIDSHQFVTERLDEFVALLSQSVNDLRRDLLAEAQNEASVQETQDSSPITVALDLVEEKKVDLFLDEVKTPYALVRVNGHLETIPIRHQNFEDWVGALYYRHNKAQGRNQVLSKEMIGRIQSILSFEARENDMKTLHLRVAAFLDTQTKCDENVVFYDLCNKNCEIVKITRNGWDMEPIEQNYKQVLFKRFAINNPQVYPKRDYPSNIMDQFIKLTNVHGDENNRLLTEVYIISLFLLANLPKPILIPHGLHGSGKSTFHEFIRLVVDPAAAPTTAFPRNTEELIQVLSHSYLTFFDNVSELSQLTADQLCRAVTGSGFTKRGLYTNDDDFIYNMRRAVGYNGINITTTRPDLLDRILNIQLKRIDKRRRETVELLTKELTQILPYILGYIFDVIVKVLNRLGEVKLVEKPRMADFAKMGELIARCLGYKEGKFTEVYNANIGLTNEEAISSNPVATAIIHLMDTTKEWEGFSMKLLSDLNVMIKEDKDISWISDNKEWPKGPTALSQRLTEVIPNLADIGIIVDREFDSHTRTNKIFIKRQPEAVTGLADADDRSKPSTEGVKNEEGT
jgi:hypothetical protein